MYSQPSVAFGRVFVGNDNGVVYSLDASRAASIGRIKPICLAGSLPLLLRSPATPGPVCDLFVTRATNAYALDAHTGNCSGNRRSEPD